MTFFKSLLIFKTWALALVITFSKLLDPIKIITCFLDNLLVVIFSLGLLFWLNLFMTLWISETLLGESFGKVFLILIILLILLLDIWAYDRIFCWELGKEVWFFLKNLDFSKTFLLSLREIKERTLEILACFTEYYQARLHLCRYLLNTCKY